MEFAFVALLVAYLVPWMFAVARNHEHQASILAANLLFGWTGVGWGIVCVWAIRSDPTPSRNRPRPPLVLVDGTATLRSARPAACPEMVVLRGDG